MKCPLTTALLLAVPSVLTVLPTPSRAASTLSLAGQWRFQLDRADAGLAERWFEKTLPDRIQLPGSLPAQGVGDDVTVNTKWTGGIVDRSWFTAPEYEKYRQPGHVKVPFWLQPEKYYVGAAWYQRDIEIPAQWKDQRVMLSLERPHWETRLWVDGRLIGTNNALATPHEYDLGPLTPGPHTLTLRVDNRLVVDIGENSHSISDHTQGNWNGIVGRLELTARPPVWITDVQVYPRVSDRSARVWVRLANATGRRAQGKVSLFVEPGPNVTRPLTARPVSLNFDTDQTATTTELEVVLGERAELWDEFTPALYRLRAEVRGEVGGQPFEHAHTTTFGLREFTTQGTRFLINGRPTFIRGTLECAIFPRTGHPPVDVESWRKVIRAAQAHGLNNLRFHSFCPPEAAFVAADELGMYLHVEASSWANQSTTLGDGKPVDQWIYDETDRILKYYGNHPSFLIMPYGNEPGGRNHVAYLKKWVAHYKARDPRRLWTSGAGWPQIPENQWHSTPEPRIQAWGGGLKSRINARPPETMTDYRDYVRARPVPVISHEIGQWCVYPNFDEIPKYTGYLKPRNFEIFRDLLEAHGLGDLARPFLHASGKLQTLCYKEDIESALRTPGMGGFQLLDLHDFPGQGTALVGVLDPFWEEKGYVTPAEYRRFCNATVPLARLPKRVFTQNEMLPFTFDVAHFGPEPLSNVWPTVKFVADDGKVHLPGHASSRDVLVGDQDTLAEFNYSLANLPAPARYKLTLGLARKPDGRETLAENEWDIWVYPPKVDLTPSPGVLIADALNAAALAALDAGGKVLLLIPPEQVRNAARNKVVLGFSSIFWNTAWTRRQPPTTLGILCDPRHPALADFPTDFHSNWQWWYLVTRAGAMILDDLPRDLRPIVQVIDDWFTARKLGLLFEARLGRGKLLICSVDLQNDLDANPVARQFRHSLLRYMAGESFQPRWELTADQVRSLMGAASLKHARVKSIRASSAEEGYEPENALDGDPNTIWHTAWTGRKPGFPHDLTLELHQPLCLRGLTVWPRQDGNRNGWIKEFACHLSDDGKDWGDPVARGTLPNDAKPKTIAFTRARAARFVRLSILSGQASGPYASLAELELLPADPL